jgi:lipoprotein-anchoring transpeptidase ErfK/SrfK
MIGRLGLFLLAGSALAAIPAAPALAQTYRPAPEPYFRAAPLPGTMRDERLPAPGYLMETDDDDLAPVTRLPQRRSQFSQNPQNPVPAQAQPPGPPSNIVPENAPQSGHQLDAEPVMRPPGAIGSAAPGPAAAPPTAGAPAAPASVATLPPDDQPETGAPQELAPNLKKQLVDFSTKEPAGTIVVDTANTYLYLVLGGGKAMRYGVRVGRDGFTWTGTERISRMTEWPDWHPPAEMIERQPYLPRFMAGGNGNPLGARAMYLGKTLYRIHGTNQPSTIGKYVSSGCVGMLNEDVEDLFSRVQVGTRVVVLPGQAPASVANSGAAPEPANPMAPPRANTPAAPAPAGASGTAISSQPLPPVR